MQDRAHFISAGLYMLDHHFLFRFLNTKVPYRVGFYASFALFGAAMHRLKARRR